MSFNLNKPKMRVAIVLPMIALVVILVLIASFIKNNVMVNKIDEIIEQGSVNLAVGKIIPIAKSKQIGYISKVYQEGGKRYLKFDDVKFLTGNVAIEAAKKDGAAVYEDGEYYVYDDYYIVNNNKEIKSYVIADNASLNVIGWWIDSVNGDINSHSVSYDNFKNVSSKYENMLCYIYTENDVVVKIEGQYTP